jgi:hypothetical protein
VRKLSKPQLAFFRGSAFDSAGKLFFHEGRVFRAIYSEEATAECRKILEAPWLSELFDAGVVKTWIPSDISVDGVKLVLEHERIPFTLHPAECTSHMHWLSAKALIRVASVLSRRGHMLKDAHPWNLMFARGRPKFVDFGSLIGSARVPPWWLDEFRRYFGVPVWLATRTNKFALEYRRQHEVGFGIALFESALVRATLLRSLMNLERHADRPAVLFEKIDAWLDSHRPRSAPKEVWASYAQEAGASDPLSPLTQKQRFVFDVLASTRPERVLDCAANKGYYAEMAARLGASVAAFDYEEFCVAQCLTIAQTKDLDITPALMDFRRPTPPFGSALSYGSAYERFQSNVVLALGLCHHICIAQSFPVEMFCDICMEYGSDGVVLEYVDPADVHVAAWKRPAPPDYSLEGFAGYFSKKFPRRRTSEDITSDGLVRKMVHFSR